MRGYDKGVVLDTTTSKQQVVEITNISLKVLVTRMRVYVDDRRILLQKSKLGEVFSAH